MASMNLESNYWLNLAVRQIVQKYPEGDLVVSSGISPSASYHIGHFRETLTADALAWGLRQAGRKVIHKHVVDNFDPLRRRYDFLPEEYEQYVGWPICLLPDPFEKCIDEHKTYAEHFYREFEKYAVAMGVGGEKEEKAGNFVAIRSYEQLYASGKMAPQIEKVVDKSDLIRQIFKEVSNRDLREGWLPLQLLGPNKSFNELKFKSIDVAAKIIVGVDESEHEHSLDYTRGEVKLNWRLDWPARWQILGVQVEPFGVQEHGAAGSSYDTGVAFSEKVFGYPAPMPAAPYGNIHLLGDNTKMSSSKGNLITPEQALQIMPAEILRYFIVRSKPERTLYFDSGVGLFNLIDEFSQIQEALSKDLTHEFADAYYFATANTTAEKVISSVPFNHLVTAYQTARGDLSQVVDILARTGWKPADKAEEEVLGREIVFVSSWLERYAPDSIKFQIQPSLPKVQLSDTQRAFLGLLAAALDKEVIADGQKMHNEIYTASEGAKIKPAEAFEALYLVILNKKAGPKAGWFLASLEHEWLVKRLREATEQTSVQSEAEPVQDLVAQLDQGRQFKVESDLLKAFPNTAIGYCVADIEVEGRSDYDFEGLKLALEMAGVTLDNIANQPEIKAWREAYKIFGVKPSDYRSSVEALVRRVLADKPWHVNSIVDTYNAVSVKYVVAMGAMDLDEAHGDINLRFGKDGELANLMGVEEPVVVSSRQPVYADDEQIITWLWNYRDAAATAVTAKTKKAVFFIDSVRGREAVETALKELVRELEQKHRANVLTQGILSAS